MCVVWAGDDRRRPYLLYSQLKNQVGILLMIRETCESGWSMVQVSISMLLITENITGYKETKIFFKALADFLRDEY